MLGITITMKSKHMKWFTMLDIHTNNITFFTLLMIISVGWKFFYISICLKIHTFISWQSLNTKGANLDINWPKTIILMIYDTCWPRNENYEQYLEWGVIIWVNKTLCLAFLENHLFTAPGSFNSQLLVNALKTYTDTTGHWQNYGFAKINLRFIFYIDIIQR